MGFRKPPLTLSSSKGQAEPVETLAANAYFTISIPARSAASTSIRSP